MNATTMGDDKVIAIIPCYNESKTIGGIITAIQKYINKVIVCDDASTDNTAFIAGMRGALVIKQNKNRGAGYGTEVGLNIGRYNNADAVVTLDGDGQHNPDEIPRLVKPIVDGVADLVIGSRFLSKYQMPSYRKFGIDIITWLYNVGHKQKITDAQSCFRAYSHKVLKEVLITEAGFSFSVETLIKVRAKGFRIVEVPISCIYHEDYRQNSSLNPVKHGIGVALGVVKWRVREELV